jgi:hypothetical protein
MPSESKRTLLKTFTNIHYCRGDASCRVDDPDAPNRIYFHTPWGVLIVALNWDACTQAWLPFKGYTGWWLPVVWHPAQRGRPNGI